MDHSTIKIMRYLAQMGEMSARDICADLEVTQLDLDWALHNDQVIKRVNPPAWAHSKEWYDVRGTGETQCQ